MIIKRHEYFIKYRYVGDVIYDVNHMIMQGNMTMMMCVMMNGTVESCMSIYLGMAMEMS